MEPPPQALQAFIVLIVYRKLIANKCPFDGILAHSLRQSVPGEQRGVDLAPTLDPQTSKTTTPRHQRCQDGQNGEEGWERDMYKLAILG
ncbi:hypothetical protein OOZ51_11230 [Arthrobacter sp. MI7-26]|uniref:hypothetical protein n=1 Tax=Arthrobacter sp. MI7-26 TaxID=2993653 RepID=UPI002248F09A|nr:hypothetical protein [Arthrobacter sp. MI7-26]MCX2748386.1 hypothetical protein [Arthrobacter sp. MI7-26]